MFKKDYSELSVRKHLFLWWLLTPVLMLSVTVLPIMIWAPQEKENAFTLFMLSIFWGLALGPFIGLFMWLVNRGLHAIAGLFWAGSESWQAGQYQSRVDAALEQRVEQGIATGQIVPGEVVPDSTASTQEYPMAQPVDESDPWEGHNPYGCCRYNYGPDGKLHHGSPDCQHPMLTGPR